MNIRIFVEESTTTRDNPDLPLREYFEGLFNHIVALEEAMSEYGETEIYVLSEQFGIADVESSFRDVKDDVQQEVGAEEMCLMGRNKLLGVTEESDVIVILLSTDVFHKTVGEVWPEIVSKAKPKSIWCFGAARSALNSYNFEKLEKKGCTVLTYARVGVTPLGTETREKLLECLKGNAVQ